MARTFLTNLDLNKNQIQNAVVHSTTTPANPVKGQIYTDSTTGVLYVCTVGGGSPTWVTYYPSTTTLNNILAPTAALAMNSQKITGLATPTNVDDAVTKAYVDGVVTGLDIKQSVRVASIASVTVTYTATGGTSGRGQITAAPNTLDGVTLVANDRILLKDQATGANGIWVVTTLGTGATGVWDRATDFDSDAEVTPGAYVWVEEGTQQDSAWVVTNNAPIVIGGASGTTLVWTLFSSASALIAGNGLTKTGNAIDVVGTTNRISVATDSIDISTNYVGQGTITTVGALSSGSLTTGFTAVAVPQGGTGATTKSAARGYTSATVGLADAAGMTIPQKYTASFPATTPSGAGPIYTLSWTITKATHGLPADQFTIVQLKQKNSTTYADVDADVSITTATGDVVISWNMTSNTTTAVGDFVVVMIG